MGQKIRLSLVVCATACLEASIFIPASAPTLVEALPLPTINKESRLSHAKELFGETYKSSVVRRAEYAHGLENFVLSRTLTDLPGPWKTHAQLIARTIIQESNDAQLDPLFLLAVIKRESQLNPMARGRHGEIGLMQLKPETAQWIARRAGIEWQGVEQLEDPVRNIRLGVAYIGLLRKKYNNHSLFYISAYNMGPTKLQKLLNESQSPRIYASNVMSIYAILYRDLIRDSLTRTQQVSQITLVKNG